MDPIQPASISHEVDEVLDGDTLPERYNYIVYEFELGGYYVKARTYLDRIETVSVYGPYAAKNSLTLVEAPAFFEAVLSYLKRRFSRIQMLCDDDAQPYKTIWESL